MANGLAVAIGNVPAVVVAILAASTIGASAPVRDPSLQHDVVHDRADASPVEPR